MLCLVPLQCYPASEERKAKLNDELKQDMVNAHTQEATSKFNIVVSKYNWFGKKKSSSKEAFLVIYLSLKNADKHDDVRKEAQKKFLEIVQEELIKQKNICPTHMQKILATILLKSAYNKAVESYGELKSCDFCFKLGGIRWNGNATFKHKTCHLKCTKHSS